MAANDHSSIRLGAVPEPDAHDYKAILTASQDTSTWFVDRPGRTYLVAGIAYCVTHDHVWVEGEPYCNACACYPEDGDECEEKELWWKS